VQRDRVALAGRAGQRLRRSEVGAGAAGVIAQKIGRLAHLRQRRRQSAAALTHDQPHQRRPVLFIEIGGAFQDGGTLFSRGVVPESGRPRGASERLVDGLRPGWRDAADLPAMVARIEHGDFRT
jgi:hypothetical protein